MYIYACKLKRVIDGDTIKVDIDLGFHMWVKDVSIRFARINTPEIRTRDKLEKARGYEAKHAVQEILENNPDELWIQVEKLGKYGRPIAEVFVGDDNVNDYLLEKGLAELVDY